MLPLLCLALQDQRQPTYNSQTFKFVYKTEIRKSCYTILALERLRVILKLVSILKGTVRCSLRRNSSFKGPNSMQVTTRLEPPRIRPLKRLLLKELPLRLSNLNQATIIQKINRMRRKTKMFAHRLRKKESMLNLWLELQPKMETKETFNTRCPCKVKVLKPWKTWLVHFPVVSKRHRQEVYKRALLVTKLLLMNQTASKINRMWSMFQCRKLKVKWKGPEIIQKIRVLWCSQELRPIKTWKMCQFKTLWKMVAFRARKNFKIWRILNLKVPDKIRHLKMLKFSLKDREETLIVLILQRVVTLSKRRKLGRYLTRMTFLRDKMSTQLPNLKVCTKIPPQLTSNHKIWETQTPKLKSSFSMEESCRIYKMCNRRFKSQIWRAEPLSINLDLPGQLVRCLTIEVQPFYPSQLTNTRLAISLLLCQLVQLALKDVEPQSHKKTMKQRRKLRHP